MRKIWATLLVATMGLNLVACSEGTSTPESTGGSSTSQGSEVGGEKEKVTVWAWDPAFNVAVMKEAEARYEAENPNVDIVVMDFAKSDVEQKLHTNLVSGSKVGLPEIVLIEDYNAQKYLQSYPGMFYDLTGKISHEEFAPYKMDVMTVDDKIYGVPFDSGVSALYYRKDLIEAAGYTTEDMENITWDKYIEIGKAVKEKTGKHMLTLDPNDGTIIRIMLQSAGNWYFDAEGNIDMQGNEVLKEAVSLYVEMVNTGIAKPASGWSEFVGGFNSGEVASVVTGAWITPSVMAEASQSGQWVVAPTPRLDMEGSVNASNLGGSSWYVLDGAENKDIAVDFLDKTFGKDVDFYQTVLNDIGGIATYLPALTGEAYTKEVEFFGGQAIYQDFAKWTNEIPPVNYGLYMGEAESVLMPEVMNILGGASMDDALKNAEKQLMIQIQ